MGGALAVQRLRGDGRGGRVGGDDALLDRDDGIGVGDVPGGSWIEAASAAGRGERGEDDAGEAEAALDPLIGSESGPAEMIG